MSQPGCRCRCHDGFEKPCSEPGGCGHLHRDEDRRCARDTFCAASERVQQGNERTRAGARITAQQGLCPTCERVVADTIAGLPRDYVDLTVHLGRGDANLEEKVSGSREPPAPIRTALYALAEAVVFETVTWAEHVAARMSMDWDTRELDRELPDGTLLYRTLPAPKALQQAARILAPNVPVLLALQAEPVVEWSENGQYWNHTERTGLEAALELLRLHHLVERALGYRKLVHHLPVPCPSCEAELVRENGASQVECRRRCRPPFPEEEYERLCRVLAVDYRDIA